ncbi:MAG: HisA/HisF-related TIM barrel protein [Syntrophales bacterium]|nr:HisA/HisF-related TIM barrel protein [Syntrophales bacterium]MDD5642674.1 HisA/HisF-related TIM barrel protein [Syntrophales bacterium]
MIQAETGRISTIVVSTALGPGGRGIFPYTLLPAYRWLLRAVRETGTTVFAKSATRFPRQGNFRAFNPLTWKYIKRLPDLGMLNAYGLTNHGVTACAGAIKVSGSQGFNVIPNFYPEFAKGTDTAIKETLEAIGLYQKLLGPSFWALELNFSCPNSQEAIRENVAQALKCFQDVKGKYPGLFLLAKISICHPYEFAQELEKLGVNALHALNTIPYEIVYPQKRSPLWQVGGGGVSGGPAFAAALDYNMGLRKQVSLPLIMGCGVRNREDVQRYLDAGADAVSICTLALRKPGEAAAVITSFNKGST